MLSLKISNSYFVLLCLWLSACSSQVNTKQTEIDHVDAGIKAAEEKQSANAPVKKETSVDETGVQFKASEPADKLALIIAISHYQEGSGWDDINAYNDVPLIKAALAGQGFDTLQHVAVIQDVEATKAGIKNAFETQLIHKAGEGSMVVLHYSGHGQQVEDFNGDELDQYDEAMVAYDAPKRAIGKFEGYMGERHLLDDELEILLKELREKIGPKGQVIVVLDACHSGTATRGVGKARGTHYKIGSEHPSSIRGDKPDNDGEWLHQEKHATLAPLVVLSGARAGELNYETKDKQGKSVGSLSYAFSRSFAKADASYTFQGLFDYIKLDMGAFAPHQSPQIEGDIHLKVLGGELLRSYTYFSLKKRFNESKISINGGELLGVYEGAEVAFYPIDVQDTALVNPKAVGKVVKAYLSESDILLNQAMTEEEIRNSWAFVKVNNLGSSKIYLQLHADSNPVFAQAIKDELKQLPQIQWVEENPDLLIEMDRSGGESNKVRLFMAGGSLIYENVVDEENQGLVLHQLQQQLVSFAQARYLRNLTSSAPQLALDFEIIPITVEQQGGRVVQKSVLPLEEKRAADHTLELKKGDYIKLRVTNKGERKAYFSLLDIQPDNQINVLFPNRYRTQEEYFVEAGKTLVFEDIFQIGEPYGLEYFKLIATPEPINIRPLLQQQRRGSLINTPPPSAHVETLLFRIIE